MIKVLGNIVFLLLLYSALTLDPKTATVGQSYGNHKLLGEQIGLFGILTLAAGQLIIIGGIDLSIGSTVALTSTVLCWLLINKEISPAVAIPVVLLLGVAIGLLHGLLIAVVRIQAFIVTLCFLFIYRSAARWIAGDAPMGLADNYPELVRFFNGTALGVPIYFLILLGVLLVAGVFLHLSVYGRYYYAIGSNETAARYCGIPTTLYKILAYVVCSTLTSAFAILFVTSVPSVEPTTAGNFYELYAIAAAVMGGCSLRGGEGNVLGILLGTCIIWLLYNYVLYRGFPETLRDASIGLALLLAAFIDEMLRRYYGGYRKA